MSPALRWFMFPPATGRFYFPKIGFLTPNSTGFPGIPGVSHVLRHAPFLLLLASLAHHTTAGLLHQALNVFRWAVFFSKIEWGKS